MKNRSLYKINGKHFCFLFFHSILRCGIFISMNARKDKGLSLVLFLFREAEPDFPYLRKPSDRKYHHCHGIPPVADPIRQEDSPFTTRQDPLYRTCPACLIVLIHLGLQNLSNILYASVKLSACTCHTPGTPLRCRMPGILSNRRMRCTQGGTGVGTVKVPTSPSCARTGFLRNICLNRSRQISNILISFRLIFVYLLKWLFFSRFSLAACTLRMASKADLDFMRSMTNLR